MKHVVDLFAGCGGLSLGFQNAGFTIDAAFEYWKVAAATYSQNFKHPVYQDDLTDVAMAIEKISRLKPDVIIGGPPCQDFSHAGKRIEAKRAGLTESFAEITAAIKPGYFVMENVDRAQKSAAYRLARSIFKAAGYGLTEVVLDASHYGVPQKRKRFFCIGSLNQADGFLLDRIENARAAKAMTLRDCFGTTFDIEFYYRHPRNYSRRAIFSIDEPAPTVRGVNRPIPDGYPGHPNDACPVNQCQRPLTTLERALVQTFPADFKWEGTKTDLEQMIGNAVPVRLAEFVASALSSHISEAEGLHPLAKAASIDYCGFDAWLKANHALTEKGRRDVVSRLKRASSLFEGEGFPGAFYRFQLEQSAGFRALSPSVRSQIKKAVTLYEAYAGEGADQLSTSLSPIHQPVLRGVTWSKELQSSP
jgi:DNA (cytosine-5)-methyltransferase 1